MTPSEPPKSAPSTLGDVLYAKRSQILVSEDTWVGFIRSVAGGDQLALHALYTRVCGVVSTWIVQSVRDPKIAEEITLGVFQDVFQTASSYHAAADSSVLGWIMNFARSRTIARLQGVPSLPPPTIELLLSPPPEILRPSTSLWAALSRRIGEQTGQESFIALPEGRTEPEWESVAPGILCKLMATDRGRQRVSMLVCLAPGIAYPPHTHVGVEELYLLQGELMIEDRKLYPGDYNRGESGHSDQFVWSGTGCMCVLLTSTRDVLREAPPTDPLDLQRFRVFLRSVQNDRYCLDCLSGMYDESPSVVWTCLRGSGFVGHHGQCRNCGRGRHTFRYVG